MKVCPSSCHLARVTPNVTFLWTGKNSLNTTMSRPCGRVLKYDSEIYVFPLWLALFFTLSQLRVMILAAGGDLWVTKSQHGPLPALNTPVTPRTATSHTHTHRERTQLYFNPFITGWTLVTAAAFLPCQSVSVCVAAPAPVLMCPPPH